MAPGLWTTAECQIGVLSGNLPALKPLFKLFFKSPGKLAMMPDSAGTDNKTKSRRHGTSSEGFVRMPTYSNTCRRGSNASQRDEEQGPHMTDVEMYGRMGNAISVTTDVEQTVEDADLEQYERVRKLVTKTPW